MTLDELANGLVKLLLSHSDNTPETNLLAGIIQRALLDAVGINDTTYPIHPWVLADAKRFLTGSRGRLCAELAGINQEWYLKHVNTYLQIALARKA